MMPTQELVRKYVHWFCEVHRGSLKLTVMKEQSSFSVTVDIPPVPCIDVATVTHLFLERGIKRSETKRTHDSWVTFNHLQYWTQNTFTAYAQCGTETRVYTEILNMLPGGKTLSEHVVVRISICPFSQSMKWWLIIMEGILSLFSSLVPYDAELNAVQIQPRCRLRHNRRKHSKNQIWGFCPSKWNKGQRPSFNEEQWRTFGEIVHLICTYSMNIIIRVCIPNFTM